jgi:hypothetical protein
MAGFLRAASDPSSAASLSLPGLRSTAMIVVAGVFTVAMIAASPTGPAP